MALEPGSAALTPTLRDPPRAPVRGETVRRQFARRAAALPAHGVLLREIARRLDERLAVIRLAPLTVVDVGCGRGEARDLLRARYAAARWIGSDHCLPMLAAGRRERAARAGVVRRWVAPLADWFTGAPADGWVCAGTDALPRGDGTVDLLWSNLMLHWHPAPHRVFPEWLRVLRADGLLMFSAFGPDTLKELRVACAQALPQARPLPFVDMHDFGDMMVAAGFATPVMDAETLTLTYGSAAELLREVRALGGNPRDDRAPGLPSGARARALHHALDSARDLDGRLRLSFEVVYGHAWRPAPRQAPPPGKVTRIDVDHLRAQLRSR